MPLATGRLLTLSGVIAGSQVIQWKQKTVDDGNGGTRERQAGQMLRVYLMEGPDVPPTEVEVTEPHLFDEAKAHFAAKVTLVVDATARKERGSDFAVFQYRLIRLEPADAGNGQAKAS